jgi:hypothetical protein
LNQQPSKELTHKKKPSLVSAVLGAKTTKKARSWKVSNIGRFFFWVCAGWPGTSFHAKQPTNQACLLLA